MQRHTLLALLLLVILLVAIWLLPLSESQSNKLISIVVVAVTGVYALLTYEILVQNRAMATAATETTKISERSLRLSYEPKLHFYTLVTKDPKLSKVSGCRPSPTEDYERALREYVASGQQTEFVFAVVRNIGRGIATSLELTANYDVRDTANPNANYRVTKQAAIQYLEADRAVALLVYISKVPTADDRVQLVLARISASDFYREAQGEPPREDLFDPRHHVVDRDSECLLPVT